MDLYSIANGPLLWVAFLVFVIGTFLRAALFFQLSIRKDRALYRYFRWRYVLATFGRWLFPLNRDMAKNPVFAAAAYVFHICLIVVPIWFSGHISLWEESRLGWSWHSVPDSISDWMTVLFLAAALFLFVRRLVLSEVRLISTWSDYLLLVVTGLPFLTGYFLTHGTLDGAGFIGVHMQLIHMLSAEIMLILIPFSKLSHFILFFFSRGASAIEFGRRGYSI